MKKITFKGLRRFTTTRPVKNILFIVLSLLILNTFLAFAGGPYLSQNVGTFLGKSTPTIFSDLLFLEGAIIFAAGTFITATVSYRPSTNRDENTNPPSKKRIPRGPLMIIIGVILIGLSIVVGTILV